MVLSLTLGLALHRVLCPALATILTASSSRSCASTLALACEIISILSSGTSSSSSKSSPKRYTWTAMNDRCMWLTGIIHSLILSLIQFLFILTCDDCFDIKKVACLWVNKLTIFFQDSCQQTSDSQRIQTFFNM